MASFGHARPSAVSRILFYNVPLALITIIDPSVYPFFNVLSLLSFRLESLGKEGPPMSRF